MTFLFLFLKKNFALGLSFGVRLALGLALYYVRALV